MKTVLRFILAFVVVAASVAVLSLFFNVPFEDGNFWRQHGLLFLVFVTFFPRLTLLFSGVAWGGLLWWVGLIFAPRLLVAVLATLAYWNQNPLLVVCAWLIAMGGESSEKYMVVRRTGGRRSGAKRKRKSKGFDEAKWVDSKRS